MALKDWKKLANGGYKLIGGIGEVFVAEGSRYHINKDMSSTRKKIYIFHHHYLGDGGHPDIKPFGSNAKAHAHLMKHVKTQDW